jgi:hypothetical protein
VIVAVTVASWALVTRMNASPLPKKFSPFGVGSCRLLQGPPSDLVVKLDHILSTSKETSEVDGGTEKTADSVQSATLPKRAILKRLQEVNLKAEELKKANSLLKVVRGKDNVITIHAHAAAHCATNAVKQQGLQLESVAVPHRGELLILPS